MKLNLILLPIAILSLASCSNLPPSSEPSSENSETNNQTYANILQKTADSVFGKVKEKKLDAAKRGSFILKAYQPENQKEMLVLGPVLIDYMASLVSESYVQDIDKASNFSGTFYYPFGTASIDFSFAGEFVPSMNRALFMADFTVNFGGSGDKQTFYADIHYDSSQEEIESYEMFLDMHGEGELGQDDYIWKCDGDSIDRLDFETKDDDFHRAQESLASFKAKLNHAQENAITIEEDIRQYYVEAQKKADTALGNDSGISLTPYENQTASLL